jgi:hypothetical protein
VPPRWNVTSAVTGETPGTGAPVAQMMGVTRMYQVPSTVRADDLLGCAIAPAVVTKPRSNVIPNLRPAAAADVM